MIVSPTPVSITNRTSIFLGGSIDNGKASDWQSKFAEQMKDLNVVLLNPRRKDWNPDASWEEKDEQIRWEMDAQQWATVRIYYFEPGTISPITLFELGLFHKEKYTIVCCPDDYQYQQNIKIACYRFDNVPVVNSFEQLIDTTRYLITKIIHT